MIYSVEFIVNPYLQNATPSSINVLWETDSQSTSIVEWGEYVFLTETTSGSSFSNYGNSRIHTVDVVLDLKDYLQTIFLNR